MKPSCDLEAGAIGGSIRPSNRDRFADGTHRRIALAYDSLLDPIPVCSLGADPFEVSPLTENEIATREQQFVYRLAADGGMSAALYVSSVLAGVQHASRPPQRERALGAPCRRGLPFGHGRFQVQLQSDGGARRASRGGLVERIEAEHKQRMSTRHVPAVS